MPTTADPLTATFAALADPTRRAILGRLAQGLLESDLVDELRLMVFPVVLGSGKRLFESGSKKRMRLTGSKAVGDGVLILTYERA